MKRTNKTRTSTSKEIEKFKRDTQGMTNDQKLEYLRMDNKEREKFVERCRPKIEKIEKVEKVVNDRQDKSEHIKIIKPGQVCVHVLNMRGNPLMPTSPAKARNLLKKGKAKVVQRDPFTIQLKYPTGESKQPIVFALDPGYKNVGFSARTEKRELISGEVTLRTDIPDKLKEKKMYRRGRRSRNVKGYRKPGFENRRIKEGWLAPSIQHKLDTYVRLVDKVQNILPITSINVETSPFDTQKMMNPEISGIEYQQGTLFGYEVREYLLDKWGRKCAYCKIENVPFETEHIIPTSRGGTNRISNLTIACRDCNQEKGNMTAEEFGQKSIEID